jgi:hypothetical protein
MEDADSQKGPALREAELKPTLLATVALFQRWEALTATTGWEPKLSQLIGSRWLVPLLRG